MFTVYLSSTINHERATYANAVHAVDRMKWRRDEYRMFMPDGRHLHHSFKIVRNENGMECVPELLHKQTRLGSATSSFDVLSRKHKQDSKYIDGNCAAQSNIHKQDAACAELRAIIQRRPICTLRRLVHNAQCRRRDVTKSLHSQFYTDRHIEH